MPFYFHVSRSFVLPGPFAPPPRLSIGTPSFQPPPAHHGPGGPAPEKADMWTETGLDPAVMHQKMLQAQQAGFRAAPIPVAPGRGWVVVREGGRSRVDGPLAQLFNA